MHTLVVGGGAAGMWCALHAARRGPVTLIAPTVARKSASWWAQGGIAAAAGPDDVERHAADTIAAGDGLCDPEVVEILAHAAPQTVAQLRALGLRFDDEEPALEGGHSARRVLHAGGDASGRALHALLSSCVAAGDRIERIDASVRAIGLEGGRTTGVKLDDGREIVGDRVVLATGGACGIYPRHTGPASTGDGLEMAWTAGATLADLEFVQFHPTALDVPGHPPHLLTEALRGEGAVLLDGHGRRFMERFHPAGDVAPRDVVSRAVSRVRLETGEPVRLDARPIPGVAQRFPVAAAICGSVGLDLTVEPVPVAPAAHYFCGGVLTDAWGRTSVPGLLACGEVAATGVHGANRLASNSLAEALVFGARAAMAPEAPPASAVGSGAAPRADVERRKGLPLDRVRELAGVCLGVDRAGEKLRPAVDRLSCSDEMGGNRTATFVAAHVARAALRRTESRGGHFRVDFPRSDDRWRVRQLVSRDGWSTAPA